MMGLQRQSIYLLFYLRHGKGVPTVKGEAQ